MSDDGNDKGGQTEVKAQMMYPCPFCGKSGAGTPLKMFDNEEDLGKHIRVEHGAGGQDLTKLPEKIREALNSLLKHPKEGGQGCTSWTLVTMDRSGGIRLVSSIIPPEGRSIEQVLAVEGLLMFLAENRQGFSGRAGTR
jgi:hypothetical protein